MIYASFLLPSFLFCFVNFLNAYKLTYRTVPVQVISCLKNAPLGWKHNPTCVCIAESVCFESFITKGVS